MRVAIAHSFYRLAGGEDRYVTAQAELLRSSGHSVAMVSRANQDLRPTVATALRMAYSPRDVGEIRAQLLDERPDIIHLHNPYPALGAAVHVAAARLAIPIVQTVHNFRLRCPNGLMFTEGRVCHRCEAGNYVNAVVHRCFQSRSQASAYASALWLHRFVMRLDEKIRRFIAPSAFIRDELLRWGIDRRRATIVRNFAPAIPLPASEGAYGVYVGRLSSEKGLAVLIDALAIAGDPPFILVGSGPMRGQIDDRIRFHGLRRVELVGHVAHHDAVRFIRDARFLVVPSVWDENAPMAVVEALAAGRPVVATRTGGLTELVEGNGSLCQPADPASLAASMTDLFMDRGKAERLGRAARRFAEANLSPEHHVADLTRVYEEVLTAK